MSTAVALLESPFQIVSLMEARQSGAVPRDVSVILRGDAARAEALLSIIDHELKTPLRRIVAPSLSRAVSEIRSVDRLILGDVLSGFGHVLVLTGGGHPVTVLDDGASTIHAMETLAHGGVLARPKEVASARRRPLAHAATVELRRLATSGRLDWCTGLGRFGSESAIPTIRHRFEWIGSVTVPVHLIGRSRVVLGSSLASDGLIAPGAYREWLEREIRPGRTLFFPHRREASETLGFVRRSGAATVTLGGLPIELVARGLDDAVSFSSLPSTAVLTIPQVRRRARMRCERILPTWWTPNVPRPFRELLDSVADAEPASTLAFEQRRWA